MFRLTFNSPAVAEHIGETASALRIKVVDDCVQFCPVKGAVGREAVRLNRRSRGGADVVIDGSQAATLFNLLQNPGSPYYTLHPQPDGWVTIAPFVPSEQASDAKPSRIKPHVRLWVLQPPVGSRVIQPTVTRPTPKMQPAAAKPSLPPTGQATAITAAKAAKPGASGQRKSANRPLSKAKSQAARVAVAANQMEPMKRMSSKAQPKSIQPKVAPAPVAQQRFAFAEPAPAQPATKPHPIAGLQTYAEARQMVEARKRKPGRWRTEMLLAREMVRDTEAMLASMGLTPVAPVAATTVNFDLLAKTLPKTGKILEVGEAVDRLVRAAQQQIANTLTTISVKVKADAAAILHDIEMAADVIARERASLEASQQPVTQGAAPKSKMTKAKRKMKAKAKKAKLAAPSAAPQVPVPQAAPAQAVPEKRGRGRPKKVQPAPAPQAAAQAVPGKRGRGRPKKVQPAPVPQAAPQAVSEKRRPGRPKRVQPAPAPAPQAVPQAAASPRRRGRPPKPKAPVSQPVMPEEPVPNLFPKVTQAALVTAVQAAAAEPSQPAPEVAAAIPETVVEAPEAVAVPPEAEPVQVVERVDVAVRAEAVSEIVPATEAVAKPVEETRDDTAARVTAEEVSPPAETAKPADAVASPPAPKQPEPVVGTLTLGGAQRRAAAASNGSEDQPVLPDLPIDHPVPEDASRHHQASSYSPDEQPEIPVENAPGVLRLAEEARSWRSSQSRSGEPSRTGGLPRTGGSNFRGKERSFKVEERPLEGRRNFLRR